MHGGVEHTRAISSKNERKRYKNKFFRTVMMEERVVTLRLKSRHHQDVHLGKSTYIKFKFPSLIWEMGKRREGEIGEKEI